MKKELTMKEFELTRIIENKHGTFGVLINKGNDTVICFTVEREWKMNEPLVSCIPDGTYICSKLLHHKTSVSIGDQKFTYTVLDVPARSKIRFHIANVQTDVKGCIGPGQKIGTLAGKTAVINSRKGFADFIIATEGDDHFILHIRTV